MTGKPGQYALYHGDAYVYGGTIADIARYLGRSEHATRVLASDRVRSRVKTGYALYRVDMRECAQW